MYKVTVHTSISPDSPATEQEFYNTSTVVAWSSPSWEKELQDIVVQERQSGVELSCICRGLAQPCAKWFHKGREVFSDFHMKLRQVEDTATLTIKNIREQDSGKFKCVMTGENGELETSCVLSIKEPEKIEPPVFVKELHDVEVEEEEKMELAVEVRGTPPIGVFWYHNNVEITDDSPHFLLASLGQVHTLTLLHATAESSGEYVCEAYNDFGDTDTFCFVEVREVEHPVPPGFVTCPDTLSALECETVTFTCQVKGQPMPTVLWERGGVVIANSQKYKITKIQDQHSLTVFDADQTDAGEYICHLHNPQSDVSHVCSLHVTCENNSEGLETAEQLTSRSVGVDGLHLTSRADVRTLQKGEHSSTSPEMSWRLNNPKLKNVAENVGETATTKTANTTSIKTTTGLTSTLYVNPFDVPQIEDQYLSNRPHSDSPGDSQGIISDIRQQSEEPVSHLTEMPPLEESETRRNLPEVTTTSSAVLNKSYKKADEKKNYINTDVTDFRSVLKRRDRASPTRVTKSQPSQSQPSQSQPSQSQQSQSSHNTDLRNILSRDKVKQREDIQTDVPKEGIITYDLTNLTTQTSATVFSQSVHFTTMPHSTSSVSSNNDSQPFKILANIKTEANVSNYELTSAPKNHDGFQHLDSSTQSTVEFSLIEKRDLRNSRKSRAHSPASSQSLERSSYKQELQSSTLGQSVERSSYKQELQSSTLGQSVERSSYKQELQSSTLGQSGRDNVSTQGNNLEIIRDISYPESSNLSDLRVAGENMEYNVKAQDKSRTGDINSGEILFKSEIQILGTRMHGGRDRVTSSIPNEEIHIISPLIMRISSNDNQVGSENYLNGRDKLHFESEKLTSKSETPKEDAIQSHNVSVIRFNPQMSSTPPRQEELKLEVTSVSVSMPLRSSVSSPWFQSRPHSNSMPLPDRTSAANRRMTQEDMDDVFVDRPEEKVNPDQNSSINDYRQTLQSFGSTFTWEKAPWEGTDGQDGNWSEMSSPLETEKIKRNRSSSLLGNKLDSNLYQDSKSGSLSNLGTSSQAANMSDSVINSSNEDFRNVTLNPAGSKSKGTLNPAGSKSKSTSNLVRGRIMSASTECVFGNVKLKSVSKPDEKLRKSQVSLSAERVKVKHKGRELSDVFPKSKQDISQKDIPTADSAATAKMTAGKFSNSIKISVNPSKFEKHKQDSKIPAVAEKYEKPPVSTLPRTNAYNRSQGIGAKFEESVKGANVNNTNMFPISQKPSKIKLKENQATKPPTISDFSSGKVSDKIQQWKAAEAASSGKNVKRMLGSIGKSNSNNALLESGSRFYLDKVHDRLERKRHSLQMNISPIIDNRENRNVERAEYVALSKHDLTQPSQGLGEARENLKAASLIQISDVGQKRELSKNGDKKNQSGNVSGTESGNRKADILFDRSMKESGNTKADILFDRSVKVSESGNRKADILSDRIMIESRTGKTDILFDRKMKDSESSTVKADVSQDKNTHKTTVELSVRNKGVVHKTVQNEQNSKPEWLNRKPVRDIEAKIKSKAAGGSQDRTKPEWAGVRPSSYVQQTTKENKNKSKFDLDPVFRNTNRKDEHELLLASKNLHVGDDSSPKLSHTNLSSSVRKQVGSFDSDDLNYDGVNLFPGKSRVADLFTDANTSKLYNAEAVLTQNSDVKQQTTTAITSGITSTAASNSPSATVTASAKLISMTASAAAYTTVTDKVVGKVVNSTILQPANVITAGPVVTNRKTCITSKKSVDHPEVSEMFVSSSGHDSNSWNNELQSNNLSHAVSNKLLAQASSESLSNDQQSYTTGVRSSWGKQKGLRSLPVYQAHETGHHEALGSSLDDSESVLSTASISSSSSDASNMTVDSGYPRDTLRSYVDNEKEKFSLSSKALLKENDVSCTASSYSRKFEEVNTRGTDGFKIKERFVDSSWIKKKNNESGGDNRSSDSNRNIQTVTKDQKPPRGFREAQDKTSRGEFSEESSRPGKPEASHLRANNKLFNQPDQIKQGEFTKESIVKEQENCSQASKDSENVTDVKENEDVADLSNDFGTIRKYSKKRRKNLEKQVNDGISGSADNKLVSRSEPDVLKSRFSHKWRENETNAASSDVIVKPSESSRRWKSKDTGTLFKSEEKEREPYVSRKSRFQQKLNEDNKTAIVGARADDNKPVALRPSELALNPVWRSSRSQFKKDTDDLPFKQSQEKRGKLNTSAAGIEASKVTADNSAPLSTAVSEAQTQLCPPSFPLPLQDTVVKFGSRAVLRCQLVGNPRPEVKWLLNQKLIEPSKDIEILFTHDEFAQLTVRETFTDHVGDYACWAKNSLGTVSSHCTLSLEASNRTESRALEGRRFAPPKIVFLSPSSVSLPRGSPLALTVTFLGEPSPAVRWMQGDRELVSDSRVQIVTEGNTSCMTIKSVSQSDAGKMSVCLTSCTGTDQSSVNVCIEDVPGAPVGQPHIYDIDSSSASLSWYGPASNEGSHVTHYVIEAMTQQDQTWDVIVPSCKDLSCHILGLNPCTAYQFRVLAANKHGLSAPSEHSDRVVTSDPFRSPSDYESDAYADVFTPSVEFQTQDDFPFEPREVKVNTQGRFEDVFELDKEVGKGKFGIVYKCQHRKDGTVWAAKIVKCREKDKGVIRREIDIMNKLRHPKLLLLWDAYESQRQMVLVMEFVAAGELFERVIGEDFVLTEGDCVHFLRQICEGVNYMHSNNILHLDLKPENILCMAEDSNRIKIIDFGLAQFHKAGQSTKVLFGTPEFIAPEVINYEEIGFVTDMWSIGVICYVLLSGLSPFLGDNDAETLANVTFGEFDFDDEAFDEISDEAKHFISQLLIMKKEKRLLTDKCLAHVWLNPKGVGGFRRRRLNTERLKRFMVRRKWLKTGNAVMAVSRLLKSSNLSSLSAVNSNNNVVISPQPSSMPPIPKLLSNVEEVAEVVRHQNQLISVENTSAQFSGKDLEHTSQGVSEKINILEENSTLSGDCGDSRTTAVSSVKNTVGEQTLTNPADGSLNVEEDDVFRLREIQANGNRDQSLNESQTNHSIDQNDNQVRNDNSHILATRDADVNHNMNQSTSSVFLELPSSTAVNSKVEITNRTETNQNTPAVADGVVLQAPVFTKSMMSSTTCVGDVARFDVVVIGDPIPNVTWYFEDEEIHSDSRHKLDSNHPSGAFSLVIRSIEEDDEGEYTCKAVNSQGEIICVAELSVLEM